MKNPITIVKEMPKEKKICTAVGAAVIGAAAVYGVYKFMSGKNYCSAPDGCCCCDGCDNEDFD